MIDTKILQKQWTEAPTDDIRPVFIQPPRQSPRVQRRGVAIRERQIEMPLDDYRQLQNLSLVALNHSLGWPIEYCEPLMVCGRVAVVQWWPYRAADPIMPVPLLRAGWWHDWHWCALAEHVIGWNTQARGVRFLDLMQLKVKLNVRLMLQAISTQLTPVEFRFYRKQAYITLADPLRVATSDYGLLP